MSYDGFYSELSSRGTANDALNQIVTLKDKVVVLAAEAEVSADRSENAAAIAEVKATEAINSAASALTSKESAEISETRAGLSAQQAAIALVATSRFCGVSAIAPSTRLDGSALQQADEWYNSVDKLYYSWNGTAWVDLNSSAYQLEERMAEPFGSSLSGWVRSKLTSGITRANQALDALPVSVWETAFVMLITDKPVLTDPDTWDWRPALNAFAAYLTANHCHGRMPPGRYKVRGKISVKATYGWGFIGSGNESTIIEQMLDNTPIFDLGAIAGDSMHSYIIKDMQLTYTNIQPSANTLANPINFSAMGFEGDLLNISFMRGSWAIRCAPGVGGPWGQTWDGLQFKSGLTGGAADWTGATNSVPNNKWGRFIVTATNMKGPIFKQVRGYNWIIDALEMLDGKNAQWFDIQAGSEVTIHAIKMELLKYTGVTAFTGAALIYAPQGTVLIGQMHVGGTVAEMTPSDALSLINTGAGGYSEIKALTTTLTVPPVNFYLSGSSGGACNINYVKRGSNPMVDYTNIGGNAAAEAITVTPDKNDKLSQPLGDATYLVTYQSPSISSFETPFTAPRDYVLPANNTCFNGLTYRIESRGSVNGSNTLTIKAGGFAKATLSADKTWIEFRWRRNAVPHAGWVVVGYGTLP